MTGKPMTPEQLIWLLDNYGFSRDDGRPADADYVADLLVDLRMAFRREAAPSRLAMAITMPNAFDTYITDDRPPFPPDEEPSA